MKFKDKTIFMKFRILHLLLFTFIFFLTEHAYSYVRNADSLSILFSDTIRIASELDYPPYCIVDENGMPDGFAVELLKAAADAVGLHVQIKIGLWNVIKQELADGKIDALPLVGKTPEREEIFDFTFPYLSLHGAIFLRKGTANFNSLNDLKGKEILVMKGDNAEEFLRKNKLSNYITTTNTFEDAFIKLANGEGDAILTQRVVGLNLIKQLKLKTIIASKLQIPDYQQDFCFAVQKEDSTLLSRLNEGLFIVIANKSYYDIHAKWFGPTPKEKVSTQDIIKMAVIIFLPLLIIMALFLIFFLRREVRRQTKQLKEEIIERKQIEAKAIKERNKVQQYLDIAGVMLLSIDNGGIVQLVNPKTCEILGYVKEEILGKNWYNNFLPEYEIDRVKNAKSKVLQGNFHEMLYFENKIKTKSGEERLIAWRNALLKDEDGFTIGTLGSGEDITEKKRAEVELIEAKEKAEESDHLKTAFLQNLSHEIRTPMNSIMGFASLLPDEEDKALIDNYSDIIVKNSEQLVHIIDDIVIFSRLQNKQLHLSTKQFDFHKLLNGIQKSFNIPEYQKGVDLVIDNCCDSTKMIDSDHEKVWQIFTNLISNAFKYTPSGTVTFGIKQEQEQEQNELICFVKDTGIGIPEKGIDHIFERFYRASNVDKGRVGGTGLGLSIAQELVKLLGGEIWVESEEGKGSTFYFTINSSD